MFKIILIILLIVWSIWYYQNNLSAEEKIKVDNVINKTKAYVEILSTSIWKAEEVRDTYNEKNKWLENELDRLENE